MRRFWRGVLAGVIASAVALRVANCFHARGAAHHLVAEDASASLRTIAIHYAPAADAVALGVWTQLFAVLPADVTVEVEVAARADFARFTRAMTAAGFPHLERFHAVEVGAPITTWSRDRYAALDGAILAPPKIETASIARAGDARSPAAIAHALYDRAPRTSAIVFEGGDLAATPRYVFADVNLVARNLGRGDAVDRDAIEAELHHHLAQELVWLGDALGEVPRHHIMMYMVPLDDDTVAVGDVRAGVALLAGDVPLADVDEQAARFDRAAALIAARGFHVVRVPAVVLAGGGAFITYTNALFDRRGDRRIVYLPTYAQPALDAAGRRFYEARGYEVHPIDVSAIYHLNGSLGCLVNVLARG